MRNLFFTDSLELEVNVIGYHNQGESIVFFIKADGHAVYTGLVDCYRTKELNIVKRVLEKEQTERLDFVCWTHPHDDHTIGLDEIWDEFCTEETHFCCTNIVKAAQDLYSKEAMAVFQNITDVHKSRKKKKIDITYISDFKKMERLMCVGNGAKYKFEIFSFAPKSAVLGERIVNNKEEQGNIYSVGLYLFFGEYSLMLAGDVENQTLRRIVDEDMEYPVDYIKMPHHGSMSASFLPDKLEKLEIAAPNIATTTLYRRYRLPQNEVIDRYYEWGCQEIYTTGNIEDSSSYNNGYGIIRTTFDILEKNEYIETELIGDAIPYAKELVE